MHQTSMTPEQVIAAAITEHRPVRIFACFSGGDDSLVTTHFAMRNGAYEVLHINTGIGIKQTREFVRTTCRDQRWPLREEYPPAKQYRDMVLEKGFPGPAAHVYCYSRLKERAVRKVVRECKTDEKDRVMLITGVRNQESARRMGYVQPVVRFGAQVWVAPMYDFSKRECLDYIEANGLQRSPVVELLHMSGECLCGAFAKPGEFKEIEMWFPETAAEIRALEEEARAAGVPSEWGVRPRSDTQTLPMFQPMCVGCGSK